MELAILLPTQQENSHINSARRIQQYVMPHRSMQSFQHIVLVTATSTSCSRSTKCRRDVTCFLVVLLVDAMMLLLLVVLSLLHVLADRRQDALDNTQHLAVRMLQTFASLAGHWLTSHPITLSICFLVYIRMNARTHVA